MKILTAIIATYVPLGREDPITGDAEASHHGLGGSRGGPNKEGKCSADSEKRVDTIARGKKGDEAVHPLADPTQGPRTTNQEGGSSRPKPKPRAKAALREDTTPEARKWLDQLSDRERQKKINEWSKMTTFDFERECNIIKSNALLDELGISGGIASFGNSLSTLTALAPAAPELPPCHTASPPTNTPAAAPNADTVPPSPPQEIERPELTPSIRDSPLDELTENTAPGAPTNEAELDVSNQDLITRLTPATANTASSPVDGRPTILVTPSPPLSAQNTSSSISDEPAKTVICKAPEASIQAHHPQSSLLHLLETT